MYEFQAMMMSCHVIFRIIEVFKYYFLGRVKKQLSFISVFVQ